LTPRIRRTVIACIVGATLLFAASLVTVHAAAFESYMSAHALHVYSGLRNGFLLMLTPVFWGMDAGYHLLRAHIPMLAERSFYPMCEPGVFPAWLLNGVFLVALGVVAYGFLTRRQSKTARLAFFCMSWFIITLAPVAGIKKDAALAIPQLHRLCVAAMFFFMPFSILCAGWLHRLRERISLRNSLSAGAVVLMLIGYVVVSVKAAWDPRTPAPRTLGDTTRSLVTAITSRYPALPRGSELILVDFPGVEASDRLRLTTCLPMYYRDRTLKVIMLSRAQFQAEADGVSVMQEGAHVFYYNGTTAEVRELSAGESL
jgi:hypothetical protein